MKTQFRLLVLVSACAVASLSFGGDKNLNGTWMVVKDGKPSPMMKLVFTNKGEFRFVGANYSSSGQYRVSGNSIRLLWTKVDNQKVKLGTMKKDLALSPEYTFTIDQYTYAKAR